MAETDTDAADQFDARISRDKLDEHTPGLWQRYRRLPRNVYAISFVSLLNDASSEMIYPVLPLFLAMTMGDSVVAIGITAAVVGRIEGAAESISSLLKLFAGYFSDRHGRRKGLVVFGYALAGLARPLLAFATSWYHVLAIRLTDRVGKGIRSAPRDAMIADAASVEERGLAFGFHRALDHAGAVAGPLLSLLVLSIFAIDINEPRRIDYTKLFLAASIPALASVLIAALFIKELPREQRKGAKLLEKPKLSLRGFDSNFKRFLIILALFTLSNSSDAFLLLRVREAGGGIVTTLLIWAALHTVKVLSSLIGGDLSDRVGRKRLIASGWLMYAMVYAGFAFLTSIRMAWVLFLLYGIYFGLAEGAEKALVADLVRPEQHGTAYGLYNLAFSIAVFPASLLMGAIWQLRGAKTAFLVSAGLGAFAALLLLLLVKPQPEQRAAPSQA